MPPMDMNTSASTLEAQGFTVVRHTADEVVAVRQKFYWSCCMRMGTIVRVHRTPHQTLKEAKASQKWLLKHAGTLDVSSVPRGFAQGRSIIDIFTCDTADDDVVKFMGGAYHPVVVTPEATTHDNPIWGAAYWPFNKHLIQQVADGDTSGKDDPLAMMGLFIGLWVMWPGMLTIAAGCCGLPLAYLPLAWHWEKGKLAALPEAYGIEGPPAQLSAPEPPGPPPVAAPAPDAATEAATEAETKAAPAAPAEPPSTDATLPDVTLEEETVMDRTQGDED
jgi:hypothetical protein